MADPATPQILNAFLVPSRADDSQRVEIHRALDNISGIGLHPFAEDGVPFEQDVLEQMVLVMLGFDTA